MRVTPLLLEIQTSLTQIVNARLFDSSNPALFAKETDHEQTGTRLRS